MDTTVALFFSLGIVMSPADKAPNAPQVETVRQNIAQHNVKSAATVLKRHEQVKKSYRRYKRLASPPKAATPPACTTTSTDNRHTRYPN